MNIPRLPTHSLNPPDPPLGFQNLAECASIDWHIVRRSQISQEGEVRDELQLMPGEAFGIVYDTTLWQCWAVI